MVLVASEVDCVDAACGQWQHFTDYEVTFSDFLSYKSKFAEISKELHSRHRKFQANHG